MIIHVRLFGMLQLDSGFSQVDVEANNVDEAFSALLDIIQKRDSNSNVTLEDIENSVLMINGKQSAKTDALHDGDNIYLMSPVHGG